METLKVFYLDDEVELCENFSDLFSTNEVIITTFTDPKLAIEAIKKNPPDLFFLDYSLPGISGDEVAQNIDPCIPMVLVSGELSPVTVHQFVKIVKKPYKNKEILELFAKYAPRSIIKILIVDDESELTELVELLVLDNFPDGTQVICANSGNAAIQLLRDDKSFDVCICDHNMPNGMGSDVMKYIINEKSNTKFVLCSTVIPKDRPQDYPSDHVYFNIQKPRVVDGVKDLLKLLQDKKSVEQASTKDNYIPISIHVLELIGKAPTDLYLRMSEDKFLKCINRSEFFTKEDTEKYLSKVVVNLFVKKGEQDASFNEMITASVEKILQRRTMPLADKLNIAHTQLVELIKFTGITPELAEGVKKNIQQSVELMMKSPVVEDFWKGMNMLGDYPAKLYTLHSLLASVLVKKLNWHSEITLYKFTFCSFLQDVSLRSIALMEMCDYQEFVVNESRFSRVEIKSFIEHPAKSVEILNEFKTIPPDTDRILLEQHEMPSGDGFPRKLNAQQLGKMSCLFIVTGMLARHILREAEAFDIDRFVTSIESKGYNRGNFKESFLAIKSMKAMNT